MNESRERRTFSAAMRDANSPFLPSQRQLGDRPIRVGFVLLEHFSMMAFTAAVDAIVTANLVSTAPLFSFSTYGLGTQNVRSDLGIDISANSTLDHLSVEGNNAVDVLIVCGGFRCALGEFKALAAFLKTQLNVTWCWADSGTVQ